MTDVTPVPKPSRDRGPVPAKVRAVVQGRSRGVCECGRSCTDRAQVMHHRLPRSAGGRHTAANLLHLADAHHRWIHDHPAAAYELGLLIRRGAA